MVQYKTKDVKVKQLVTYGGHSITANGLVNLTFNASYSELVNTIQLTQMLNSDVNIAIKIDGKTQKLGMFRVKQLQIDSDGESKIKFNGNKLFVETDIINEIPLNTDDVKEFRVMYKAEVEYEEEVDMSEIDTTNIFREEE